jgi:hypothetical protein
VRFGGLLAMVAVVACKQPTHAPATAGSATGSGSAQPVAAGSAAQPADTMVELLHSAPATIRVSSRVANKAILPTHIADRDVATAWNSRTGELRGAWVDLTVPGAAIQEVRLTVGHTGKGPKGEDYFTMNPRIRKVTLLDGDDELAHVDLDVGQRGLQVVKLPEPQEHLRLRVDDVVMGTKPAWRETCISEIEAWGTLPAGATARALQPVVEVYNPTDVAWQTPPLDPSTYCTRFLEEPTRQYDKVIATDRASCDACIKGRETDMARWGECQENGSCNPDPPGPPSCSLELTAPVSAGAWRGAGTMATSTDSQYSSIAKQIVVATRVGAWPIGDEYDCGHLSDTPLCEVTVTAAKLLSDGKLEVTATYAQGATMTDLTYVCAPSPVSCERK